MARRMIQASSGIPLGIPIDPFREAEYQQQPETPALDKIKINSVYLLLDGAVTSEEKILLSIKARDSVGAHDGEYAAAALVDSDAGWTIDALIGKRVYNLDDGSVGEITDNDATSVTATLAGGTDNEWNPGDHYMIINGEARGVQAIQPWDSSDADFLVVMDECFIYANEILEIYHDNTDDVSVLTGSNAVFSP